MRKSLVFLILLVFSFMAVGCGDNSDPNKVVGVVNGTEITQGQLDKHYMIIKTGYESQMGKELTDKEDGELIEDLKEKSFEDIVLQTVVRQNAEQKNIKISAAEIEEELKAFKDHHGEEGYKEFLKQMQMTEADLKEQIEAEKIFLVLRDEVTADVVVSDEEIEEFYAEEGEMFTEPGGMEVFHILVEKEDEAKDILAKLENGEDFADLAVKHSTCPSKEKGGDLGLINEESPMVEEFKVAALALKSGEMVEAPVKTEFGYHLIKAGEYKEPVTLTFEEVKSDIQAQLEIEKGNELFNGYLQELKDKAEIEDKRK
ncbi:MAG TPA: SurA N-terminal domain-containing protein [Syntrophomonadaceae bacterium]|nr:SurA N-terminal domain-containing protein [Syntrophomonadaceae bacterium]